MTTFEKYRIIVNLCGISYGTYKSLDGAYHRLTRDGVHITENNLKKDNLILANRVWKDVKELYDTQKLYKAYVSPSHQYSSVDEASELIERIINDSI